MKKYYLLSLFGLFLLIQLSAQNTFDKTDKGTNKILRLVAANGSNTDEAVIYFNSSASNGSDGFDSPKMFTILAGMPQLYTTIGTDTLVINGLNDVLTVPVIPLGFRTSTTASYTITATAITGFDAAQPVLLLDTIAKVVQNLRTNPVYTFTSSAVNSMGRFLVIFSNTWTGNTSSDWSLPANWSSGAVPLSTENVYLTAYTLNAPHITTNYLSPSVCNNLIIQKGATLTVDAGKALTAAGRTTNYGTFTIKSDATSIGSFIDNGTIDGSGSFIVEKEISGAGGATPNGRFWYQSSPVALAKSIVYDAAGTNRLWYYDETASSYYEILNNTTSLDTLTGYALRIGANTTISYTGGIFNTGNISNLNLTRTGTTSAKRGYSLFGNPYPSFIDWDLASKSNLQNTIWFRTSNLANVMVYDTYNSFLGFGTNNNGVEAASSIIAPTQSFWVRVSGDGNTGQVALTNSIRQHSSANTLKKEKLNTVLRMVISEGTNTDELVYYFNPSASDGSNGDNYDSPKMFSLAPGLPQIYSIVGTDTLSINGMNSIAANPIIPLGFRTLSAGTFTLTKTQDLNFDPSQTIYLQDNLLGVLQNLRTDSVYTFTSGIVNTGSRFNIVFDLATETSNLTVEPTLSVFNSGAKISVILNAYNEPNGFITVTNILGQEMLRSSISEKTTEINSNLPKGIYIVNVQTNVQKLTKKIIIN